MDIRIGCRALIIYKQKILLVKCGSPGTRWILPGGKLEHGEGVEEATIREIHEELGIIPKLGHLAFINQFTYTDQETKNGHGIDFIFTVTNTQDFLQSDFSKASHAHEIFEYKWHPIDTLQKLEMLPKKIIPDLQNNKTLPTKCFIPPIQN